ncbi:MAG: zinc-dependent peptidase, partial [Lentisphaerae bacterium]|nr:zinc-dependent peptidase [Lentisphaerota bacterium]
VLHEFAHQLDQEDGAADGAPILGQRSSYVAWARVLGKEYETLRRSRGKQVMDRYGATDPAEFFAVLTETFFEKPSQLHKKHPELYEQAKAYYRVDPLAWR